MDQRSLIPTAGASPGRRIRLVAGLFAVAMACSAAVASAQMTQTIYKHVDGQGRTTFTDRPGSAAIILAGYMAPSAASRELTAGEGAGEPPAPVVRSRTLRAEEIDRNEAHRRLQQAQGELARGVELQQGEPPMSESVPGERKRDRLNKQLRDVEAARARVREVSAERYTAARGARAAAPARVVLAADAGDAAKE